MTKRGKNLYFSSYNMIELYILIRDIINCLFVKFFIGEI